MKSNRTDRQIFSIIGYTSILSVALLCFFPFLMIISGSFSSEAAIFKHGYGLLPKEFTFEAYKYAFRKPEVIGRAYLMTFLVTGIGTAVGLYLTAMTGYVLNRKELKSRNLFSLYFYFTTLFSGGLVPWYLLMMKYLNLKNNFLAMVLPLIFSVFYIIIMRSFMSTIPDAIIESAKIDGAAEFYIFMRVILPLSKPVLATIGMFTALRYWNDWYNAMLFITKEQMFPLQFLLYKLLSDIQFAKDAAGIGLVAQIELPQESFKLAMTVVVTGPIILLFPFIQKYFIKGMTVGAVKG